MSVLVLVGFLAYQKNGERLGAPPRARPTEVPAYRAAPVASQSADDDVDAGRDVDGYDATRAGTRARGRRIRDYPATEPVCAESREAKSTATWLCYAT